ncbi:hypothetical protein FWK35_00014899 [Aphis craccivora]|nr:hypothetical protein FWK35_00014899 [Aphis craccivora]
MVLIQKLITVNT